MDGHCEETDGRRGEGVYNHITEKIKKMSREGIFFGVSITVSSENIDKVTDEEFINKLLDWGCKLFFFVEYIPVKEGTQNLVISEQQRQQLLEAVNSFSSRLPGLFIAFPGDEAEYGGCMSSGRGFAHISPEGNVEPCPFAPYSDASLNEMSLKEALQSDFLKTIRQSRDKLNESHGGCALWENRDWVRSLLD